MKVLLVSSDPDFRAPVAAMLGVRGLDVYETDDVFDAIAVARKGRRDALLVLHGIDSDDAATAQRGAARAPTRTVVAVVGGDAPEGAHAIPFDGRFPPLVAALAAIATGPDDAVAAPSAAAAPEPRRERSLDELLSLARFGSYFELLDVAPTAEPTQIADAVERCRARLAALAEQHAERALLDEIAATLDDAAIVLGDAALRRLYTAGLIPSEAR